uniref:V-type proton ATPase subunit F n=1 Tax=Tetraselmis sp. GSL018 TaxID=582737 RepID=A0A061R116_9CHLO|mmetsp:Transcript_33057/g.78406  ORF Transcript_33057/g.78406 Transcript_33057/m.78406 type:complete len:126 (-) Transcript_33057:40-417(-)
MAAQAALEAQSGSLVAIIADEDTVTGFLLAGAGNLDLRRKSNFLIVSKTTTLKEIESAFKEFSSREDIAIVLISQYVADMIRFAVDAHDKPVPAVLEMPSKHHPYDPAKDSILSRARFMLTGETS